MNIAPIKIGDLIDVPDLRTVIELSDTRDLDPDDPEGRTVLELLLQSFIITDDIKAILLVILQTMLQGKGKGFFIAGNYGSGKSHLLSIIALLTRHTWAWAGIGQQDAQIANLADGFRKKRFLSVLIPLTDFGRDLTLEEIVWGAIEVTTAMAGVPLALSHTEKFLSLFEKYIAPVHQKEFRAYLERRIGREYSWERIRREDSAAAHTLLLQFLQERGDAIPFRVIPDHRTAIQDLTTGLRAAGWDGILIILDELSEFLKSKPDPQSLNEDARFLQFMGESSAHHPLWIIGALQEALERTGEIRETVFKKIKDRYHSRLRLSTRHLKELVSKRLIVRKHPEAAAYIQNVYTSLQRSFNKIPISLQEFIEIYPIHPETLEILDKNSDLFSRHRGIVDFLTTRIRGRPESQIAGLLHEPIDHLLTPDIIYDHFQDHVAESMEYSGYFRLFQSHFIPKIRSVMATPADQQSALRLIKILILLAITPIKETRTVQELANMILYCALDPSLPAGDLNYEYFFENIVNVLHTRVGHLKITTGKSSLDHIITLDLQSDLSEILENRIRRIISEVSPLTAEVLRSIYSSMSHGVFPMAIFLDRVSLRDGIRWQNTFRKIAIQLIHLGNLTQSNQENLRNQIRTGQIDFVLTFCWLGDIDEQRVAAQKFLAREPESVAAAWGFCIPNMPEHTDSFYPFLEAYACWKLISELTNDPSDQATQLLGMVKERMNRQITQTHSIITHCYQHGELFTVSGRQILAPNQKCDHFDQWAAYSIKTALSQRFTMHHLVAPRIDFSGRILSELLLERLIVPGKTTEPKTRRDESLETALASIALPLALVRKEAGTYFLTPNPKRCPAAKAIMNLMPPDEGIDMSITDRSVSLESIFQTLATSSLGISRPVFELTLVSLIRKGYLTPLQQSVVIPFNLIRLPISGEFDRVMRGRIIPPRYRPAFALMYRLLIRKQLKDLDLDVQDDLWNRIRDYFSEWQDKLQSYHSMMLELSGRFPEDIHEFPELVKIVEHSQILIKSIDADMDAYDGLQRFLAKVLEIGDIERVMIGMKRIVSFMEIGKTPYLSARTYINHSHLHIPQEKSYHDIETALHTALSNQNLSESLFLGDGLKEFLDSVERFKSLFIDRYTEEHTRRMEQFNSLSLSEITISSEYRLLHLFSNLSNLSGPDTLFSIDKQIQTIQRSQCRHDPRILLGESPFCHCNYRLGQPMETVSCQDLVDRMTRGIRYYMEMIHSQELQDRLRRIEKTHSLYDRMQSLVSLDPSDPHLVVKLEPVLTIDLLRMINGELFPRNKIKLRRITDLKTRLSGHALTKEQAQKAILEWLSEGDALSDSDILQFEE